AVHVNADGSFTFTPGTRFQGLAAGETGVDTFHYTATDAQSHSGTATVSVTVHGVNSPPTASDVLPVPIHPELYVRANATTQIAGALPLSYAHDPNVNDTLTLTSVAATSAQGAAVTFANGQITYDPTGVAALTALAAGAHVLDSFTYTVTDPSGATATAKVNVWVQSPA